METGVRIESFSKIGVPYRRVDGAELDSRHLTELREDVEVRSHAIICRGSIIGAGSVIEDYCKVEQDVDIGAECLIIYKSQICNEAAIGDRCVIAGFVGERAIVNDDCRVFGSLIHRQDDPNSGWDDTIEPAPELESNSFVGWGATVIGDVSIGKNAYVAAGSIVTKDVPQNTIVAGTNQIWTSEQWEGRLAESEYFIDE